MIYVSWVRYYLEIVVVSLLVASLAASLVALGGAMFWTWLSMRLGWKPNGGKK